MKDHRDNVDEFISDITPFLYRKRITFVDVGAYRGEVFRKILSSRLKIHAAVLIEPNGESYKELKESAQAIFSGSDLILHNVAVGSKHERLRLKRAKTMTKVVKAGQEAGFSLNENTFEIECRTLDDISKELTHKHISILKIDVEGYEVEVLRGADKLLSEQRVDIVYVEAGIKPDSEQQCYYRSIEDVLLGYGYGLFRVYEQKNEWIDDSPLLRRVNLSFMSSNFSQANPYQLSQELFLVENKLAELEKKFKGLRFYRFYLVFENVMRALILPFRVMVKVAKKALLRRPRVDK